MKTARAILGLVCFVGLFLAGWWLGRHSVEVRTVERIRIDTVWFERPQAVGSSERLVSVAVPRLLFAPADTVFKTVFVPNGADSVRVDVPVRTLEYRDSTYYARVVGPVVGELSPSLAYIETYGRTVVRQHTVHSPFRWEIGPVIGAYGTDRGGWWAGAYARYNLGRLSISFVGGYDPQNEYPLIGASAGISLWRK